MRALWRNSLALLCLGLLLSACGGGGTGSNPPAALAATPVPADPVVVTVGAGEFKSITFLKTTSLDAFKAAATAAQPGAFPVTPKYTVESYRLEYLTADGKGQLVQASALVNVPTKAAGFLSPVLSLQHGTTSVNAEAPTNQVEATAISVLMASSGFITLAPDYVGYGASKGRAHPYLLAEPSASVVVDLLTAAKYWRQTTGVKDNGQLFLSGYSEGAYVTMAAARAMETTANVHNKSLVAAVVGGGPYQAWVTLDELFKVIRAENPLLGALVNPGFLRYMGASVRASVRNEFFNQIFGPTADVEFDATLIDNYLADDSAAIDRQSNVHDWKPSKPIKMYHGQNDQTVSYLSSATTLQTMQAKGSASPLSLTDCGVQPATHLGCVPDFWRFVVRELDTVAKDR